MVIDAAKGVEDRTRKLMEVTRLRDTPIITFMNKLDRDIRDPMELLDEVETELNIMPVRLLPGQSVVVKSSKVCTTSTRDETILYQSGQGHTIQDVLISSKGKDNPELDEAVGSALAEQSCATSLELVIRRFQRIR